MTPNLRFVQLTPNELEAYQSVAIAYEIQSRVDLNLLRENSTIIAVPESNRWKDYDADPNSRPSILPSWFDISNWLIVSAFLGEERVGGTIVARKTPDLQLLGGRNDLALIFDIRVDPMRRGEGVGRQLFEYAASWARDNGCSELRVETQDVNVNACRFYQAMGCKLHSATEGAYGPSIDETMLIWRISL